jgi:hypothetical protein
MNLQTRIRPGLALLVLLNLVPLAGVLVWGWKSFDLIFLYWMENVVIGVFTAVRMVVRPYGHPLELVFPLLLAPFFCVHYGMFTWGHGTFVVSLFGPDGLNGFELLPAALSVLATPYMLAGLGALTLIQTVDWIRDAHQRGLGADSVKDLMVKPYRRIVVLHITILAGGFALAALDEPTAGLLILMLVKTGSDVWHWKQDSEAEEVPDPMALLTPEAMAEMAEEYPEPKVTVNGEEKHFSSFAEMKRSKEFRMAQAVMRMMGAGGQFRIVTAYLDMKIAEEQGRPFEPSRNV